MKQSIDQAAKTIGVSRASLREWAHRGCPHDRDTGGRLLFEVGVVKKWRASQRGPGRPTAPQTVAMGEARRRRLVAQAELAELKLSRVKAELRPTAEAAAENSRKYQYVRDAFASLPAVMARQLPKLSTAADVEGVLEEEITRRLQILATATTAEDGLRQIDGPHKNAKTKANRTTRKARKTPSDADAEISARLARGADAM